MRGPSVGARSAPLPFIVNSATIIIRVCAVLDDTMGISGLFEGGRPAQTRSLRRAIAL